MSYLYLSCHTLLFGSVMSTSSNLYCKQTNIVIINLQGEFPFCSSPISKLHWNQTWLEHCICAILFWLIPTKCLYAFKFSLASSQSGQGYFVYNVSVGKLANPETFLSQPLDSLTIVIQFVLQIVEMTALDPYSNIFPLIQSSGEFWKFYKQQERKCIVSKTTCSVIHN